MIRFYKHRKIYFAISLAAILIGIIFIFINGINLDIQFKGGAILKYTYTGEIAPDKAAEISMDALNRNAVVQITDDIVSGKSNLVLNLAGNESLSLEEQTKLEQALNKEFKDNKLELSSSNTVEPFIGKRFLKRGMIAALLSFAIIVLYVRIRFKNIAGLSAGIMALIALLHDCLIVFFTFIIFNIPINESFIAVILTIIGYSVNDTIIIYDRLRENKAAFRNLSIEELADKSINQSMSRSINTACTTVSGALIIFIFAYIYGIDSIISFALPMAFGLISGCYSSICIAGPLWVMWQKRSIKNGSAV